MITLLLLLPSFAGTPASVVCLIIALVLFAIAAFVTPQPAGAFLGRVHWGWAAMFFLTLAVALGGK